MPNNFLISDQHFHHSNILTFLREDGTPLRTGFDDVNHMNEVMIERHNSVVTTKDKVYFLGDTAICNSTKFGEIMSRLNGEKVLIKGNHCNLTSSQYLKYFKDIRSCHTLDKFILTHIPIHPDSLSRWRANIHGHLHYQNVRLPNGELDHRYINVCVEQINYTPVPFEVIRKEFYARQGNLQS